jgi:hypothetical protein
LVGSGNEVPEPLKEMITNFQKKVKAGEARVYVNSNL